MVMFEEEYRLQFFRDNGFSRHTCRSCGTSFWTQDDEAEECGDTPCVEYSFIGNPPISEPHTVDSLRQSFIDYFARNGHTPINRYPVVARWRKDIYLTIASIADFQPMVTSGAVPPPANPLVISQPCIRLSDLDSVGRSGRHLTNFEMMGAHAFNSPEREVYWKEDAVRYCHEYMTDVLGIPGKEIRYREDPWVGGGNAGPALEVMVRGLEVATLVFMSLRRDPAGTIDLNGDRYAPNPLRVVDPGYGLERLVWASQGTPTIYDALYPDIIHRILDEAGIAYRDLRTGDEALILRENARLAGLMAVDTNARIRDLRMRLVERLADHGVETTLERVEEIMVPLERAYALADHARGLAFLLGDGVVPSNTKAGYLVRLLLRRAFRLREMLGIASSLGDLVEAQARQMKAFPDLLEAVPNVRRIIQAEEDRYRETLLRGRELVKRTAQKVRGEGRTRLELADLVEMYDTHGVPPELVTEVAKESGVEVVVPDAFGQIVASMHLEARGEEREEEAAAVRLPEGIPPTHLAFYEDEHRFTFESEVLYVQDDLVVLPETYFYPEGGGQPSDTGEIAFGGRTLRVAEVQKTEEGIVVHRVEGGDPPAPGTRITARIDADRRLAYMRHHTGTHVVNGAARAVLGPHVWQAGAQKGEKSSRLDIAHFARITPEELEAIERRANEVVLENRRVEKGFYPRTEAEQRFGFRLYQGGVPPTKELRVVNIEGFDVEACGGTHCDTTGEVGPIKLLRSERLQDGVERLVFSAGMAAVEASQEEGRLLRAAAETLRVPPDKLPETVQRFFSEWKAVGKEVQTLKERLARAEAQALLAEARTVGDVRLVCRRIEADPNSLRTTVQELISRPGVVALLGSSDGGRALFAFARSEGLPGPDCGALVREAAKRCGGSGGGKPDFAQGGAPNGALVEEALAEAGRKAAAALG